MVFPYAAAFSVAAGTIQGATQRHSATKDRRNARRRGADILRNKVQPALDRRYGESREQLERSRFEIDEGYTNALRETEALGVNSARRITEQRDTQAAGISQSATSRGLSGTTYAADANRGLEHDMQRQLSDSDARFAGIRAQLHQQRGTALSGASRDLAQHFKLRFDTENRVIFDKYFELYGGGAASNGGFAQDLSGLGGALGELGGWFGSQFGGGKTTTEGSGGFGHGT